MRKRLLWPGEDRPCWSWPRGCWQPPRLAAHLHEKLQVRAARPADEQAGLLAGIVLHSCRVRRLRAHQPAERQS